MARPIGGRSKTAPFKARAHLKQKDAFQLRAEGYSYRQISDELGISIGSAYQLVEKAFKERPIEQIELERAKRLEQLDEQAKRQRELIEKWLPRSEADEKAAKVVVDAETLLVKIGARRDAITGAEAPKSSEVTLDAKVEQGAHDDVLSALAALATKGAVGSGDPPADT